MTTVTPPFSTMWSCTVALGDLRREMRGETKAQTKFGSALLAMRANSDATTPFEQMETLTASFWAILVMRASTFSRI